MTPTEQDKELLEKQIHKLFGDGQAYEGGYHSCYDGKWIDMTNEVCAVADFITADRKRVGLEARLDELTKLRRMFERLAEYAGDKEQAMSEYDDRIATLKQELESYE